MVSSALDADKMDYLLRDAYYAGVRYGQFDLDKVIESCRLLASEHESYLAIDHEGIYAVEQLLLSKHYMTQQVYAHRLRTVTDAMIVRGLNCAIRANEEIRAVYAYDGSAEHLSRYLREDDSTISQKVLSCGEPRAAGIFGRLRERRLFKELALLSLDTADVQDALIRRRLMNLTPEEVSKIEGVIADHLGREPWEIIFHKKSIKNPAYQPPGEIEPEAIYILRPDGTPAIFSDLSEQGIVFPRFPATERIHIVGPRDDSAPDAGSDIRELIIQTARGL